MVKIATVPKVFPYISSMKSKDIESTTYTVKLPIKPIRMI
jgi:hypothetical protein